MKRIVTLLITILLSFTLVSCSPNRTQYTPLEELGWEKLSRTAIYFGRMGGSVECVRYMPDYKHARAVPMGKVVLSEKLLRNLESYDDDDIFFIGVCYAGMVPANVPLDMELLQDLQKRAVNDCEAAGMWVKYTGFEKNHYFTVFARKHQLLELRCSSDVALYLFAALEYQ